MVQQKKKQTAYRKKKSRQRRFFPSRILIALFLLFFVFFGALAVLGKSVIEPLNSSREKEEFIVQISGHAKTLQKEYKLLPSISIGQAILESDWGTSELATESKNLYGIKGSDPDNTEMMQTKEFVDGEWIEIKAPFRKYESWQQSMDDHALLFVNGTDWNAEQYTTVLAADNYKEAAQALQDNGYATDPTYAQKLIDLIEQYQLHQYDD
ncbi:glycoside hydrolase family 73 protein [Desemzia sp. FAM 23991]|uniref:glycoside hydrolase family 73 protein n=1 Tax=unclassified Desemzia TaxID=2685243 RepID=UPI00388AE39E